ncbi:ATP-dependent Clp protease proteolytic subunit [Parvibaculum sp.]|jgi:ATP-dependent Clp protease, protease subunit|uniref:ATP-dependent Clp protease proteolytic subunit n=1 Tax=Parvibaculum sp. TaxID=2024848 RepID=UPI0025FAD2A0|nr:ATP-dependent Clp protease proteolytic subunit [Parvibaculum sp.]
MSEHTILFSADISPATANNFVQVLAGLAAGGATKVTIALNSGGGNVVAGMYLHHTMVAMPYEIVTHNVGNVDSIANVIFMAGNTRLACRGSTFMFHGVGFDSNPAERLEEKNLREKLDVVTADHRRIASVIAGRTSLTINNCMSLFKQQSTRGADWAVQKGIIGSIADFTYPANGNFYTFFG